jgi:hypothetical protein
MKKAAFLLVVLVLAITSISTCSTGSPSETGYDASVQVSETPTEPINETKLTIIQEDWSLAIPGDRWEFVEPPLPEIKLAVKNMDDEVMFLFIREGTSMDLTEYVINTLQVFSDNDARIRSMTHVSLNGTGFILTEMLRRDEMIWSWITVKDNVGYGFTCVAEVNADAGVQRRNLCQSIANSLQIR